MARTQEIYEILVQTTGATTEVKALVGELNKANRALKDTKTAAGSGGGFRNAASAANEAKKQMQDYGRVTQNVGFQLQDFIIQVQGGTDVTRALGQQLPQVFGAFTGLGLGATLAVSAIASLVSLLPVLMSGYKQLTGAAKPLSDSLKTFNDQLERTSAARKLSVDITELAAAFGRVTPELEKLTDLQALYEMNRLITDSNSSIKSLISTIGSASGGGLLSRLFYGSEGGASLDKSLANYEAAMKRLQANGFTAQQNAGQAEIIAKQFTVNMGLAVEEGREFITLMDTLANAKTLEEQAAAAAQLKIRLLETAVGADAAAAAWAKGVLSQEGILETVDAIIIQQAKVEAQQRSIDNAVQSTLESYTQRLMLANAEAQIGDDTLAMLKFRQQAEVAALERSKEFVAASSDQQAAMKGTLKAAQDAEYAIESMAAAQKRGYELAKKLAEAFRYDVVQAIETAGLQMRRLVGEIGAAVGALGRLSEVGVDREALATRKEFELGLRQEGKSLRDVNVAMAEYDTRQKARTTGISSIPVLGKVFENVFARQAAEAEARIQDAEGAIKGLDDAAKEAATGGAAALKDSLKTMEEATKLVQAALEEMLTPAERAAAEQRELAEAMALVANSGQFTAEELAKVSEYLKKIGEDSSALTDVMDIAKDSIGGMFDALIDRTSSVGDAFKNMLTTMLADIAKFLLNRQVTSLINMLGELFSKSGAGGLFQTPVYGSTLALPQPVQFGGPTAATAGYDLDLAARVPRNVGVPSAARGSMSRDGGPSTINIHNTVSDSVDVKVNERTNSMGERELDIMVERKLREKIGNGSLDRSMGQAYGLKRRPG